MGFTSLIRGSFMAHVARTICALTFLLCCAWGATGHKVITLIA
jgi:hypothetical protein